MRLSKAKARAYGYFRTVVPSGVVAVALAVVIALALQLVPVLQPPASAAVSTSVKTPSITPKGGALKLPEQRVVASPPPGIDLTKLPGVTKTAKSDKAPILPAAADKLLPPDPKNPVAMAVAEARRTGNKAEVAGRTTETEITWANPDASLTTEIGAGPVRIKKGTSFVPADPTLILANGVIEPKAAQGSIKLSAGAAQDADLASLEAAGKKVTMGWTTALPAPTLEGDTATYHDIEPGQDLVVKATTTGFETFVVLNTRPQSAPVITVPLRLEGLTLSRDGSGQIKLADTKSKTQASIPQPVMFSSARDERADEPTQKALVDTAVEAGPGGTTRLVLRPDPGFLFDPATVYPIFIDPATTLTSSLNNFVDSAFPNTNYETDSQLKVGTYNGGGSKNRSFIKFNDGAIKGTQVSGATLRVYETWAYSCTSTPMAVQGSTALNSGSNWNSKPTTDGNNWFYGSFTGGHTGCPGTAGWKDLSITGLVQQWAAGGGSEDTLALIAPNETDNYQWKKFSSRSTANPPIITVDYTVPAPTSLPSAPQNVTASAGNTQGTISWSPPANPGNPAYIHYVVFPYQLVNGTWTYASPYAQILPASQTSIVLNGLTNGQTYQAYVYTYSTLGYGGWALSNTFVPAVPPTTPPNIVATAAPSGGATVRWSPSTTGGGASMSGYILWAYDSTWRSYLVKDCGGSCTFTTFGAQNSTPSTPLITGYPTYFYVWGYNSSGQVSSVAGSSNYIIPGPTDPTVGAGDRSRFSYDDFSLTDRMRASVNIGTGNLMVSATDLVLPMVGGGSLPLGRVLNSFNPAVGATSWFSTMFGYDWHFNSAPDMRLVPRPDGAVELVSSTGNVSVFTLGVDPL